MHRSLVQANPAVEDSAWLEGAADVWPDLAELAEKHARVAGECRELDRERRAAVQAHDNAVRAYRRALSDAHLTPGVVVPDAPDEGHHKADLAEIDVQLEAARDALEVIAREAVDTVQTSRTIFEDALAARVMTARNREIELRRELDVLAGQIVNADLERLWLRRTADPMSEGGFHVAFATMARPNPAVFDHVDPSALGARGGVGSVAQALGMEQQRIAGAGETRVITNERGRDVVIVETDDDAILDALEQENDR